MGSPPKPWERAGVPTASTSASATATNTATTTPMTSTAATTPSSSTSAPGAGDASTSSFPAVPARPTSMATTSYSPYNRFGTGYSPYGSYGSYGSYGGMGGMYGGGGMGYGGYGGMGYGGYGGYGMGGPMGMMGPGMNPMDPNNASLSQQLEASTAQTFQVLQSIVQTFGGFAQMLESTYMATHSSFFAMVGVAEQLGHLRNLVGSVLGLFGMVRWVRDLLAGRSRMGREFEEFKKNPGVGNGAGPRPSRKPLLIFLAAMVGLPYLMHRLIRSLQSRLPPPPGQIDPNNLQFVRAMYPFSSTDPAELSLNKGDIVAVLQTADPLSGLEGEWWRGRNRSGTEGWFPKTYVEIVKRPGADVKIEKTQQVGEGQQS